MKNYSVVYLEEAEEELVALWELAPDRLIVADAANRADDVLSMSPQADAIYLGEELWRLEVGPLRFYFAVRTKDRIVEVSNVLRIAK